VTAALGDPERPLDNAQLHDKAERVAQQMSGAFDAKGLVAIGLAGLQDQASCKRVADTLWDTCTGDVRKFLAHGNPCIPASC
jgi:hypothetical protein